MIKSEELKHGCMSRAADGEMTFVLLARDLVAPEIIREWCRIRCLYGKNTAKDEQIQEALRCADIMDEQRGRAVPPWKQQVLASESGWLIERSDVPEPQYAFVEDWGGFHFTTDPNKAVRFARREDAEQVLNIFENVDAKAVEHMWPSIASHAKERP